MTWTGRRYMQRPLVLDGQTFAGAGRGTVLDFSRVEPDLVKANGHACVLLLNAASLRDCTIVGLSDYDDDGDGRSDRTGEPALQSAAVRALNARGALISNVYATGGRHTCISVQGGQDNVVQGCHTFESKGAPGLAYGLSLEGCHNTNVFGGSFHGKRHGIAMGNQPGTGEDIGTSRFAKACTVWGARITSDIIYAADFHPGVEACAYVGCHIQGGLNFAGIGNRVQGGTITPAASGECVHLHGLSTLDVDIEGVVMSGDAQGRALIWYDRTPADAVHPTRGTLRLAGTRLTATRGCPIYLRNRFDIDCSVEFAHNTVRSLDGTPARIRYFSGEQTYQGITFPAGRPWAKVMRQGNRWSTPPSIGSYARVDDGPARDF